MADGLRPSDYAPAATPQQQAAGQYWEQTGLEPMAPLAPLKKVGALGKVAGFLGGPIGMGTMSLISLIGTGLGAWSRSKREREREATAQKQYEEMMQMKKAQWESEYKLAQQRFGLSRQQFKEQRRQARNAEKARSEQMNFAKAQDMSNKFNTLLNTNQVLKGNFLQRLQMRRRAA